MSNEQPRFYLQDSRSFTGTNVMWWRDGGGYTSDLSQAQVFTKQEAQAQHNMRETDIPWPVPYIDARARLVVDMQYLRRDEAIPLVGPWVIQDKSEYDGNDVYWLGAPWLGSPGYTTELDKALQFSAPDKAATSENLVAWPVAYVESKTRPAVGRGFIDINEALRRTGIKLAKPKRPKRECFNCAGCGRFIEEHKRWFPCQNCGADNRP